jgi:GST-like protein
MQLYGVRGWGSAIAEALLATAKVDYAFIDVTGFDTPGAARDRLIALNPLAQVPTLVLDDGTVLTESAAIALYLADRSAALAPSAGDPERVRFLRLLIWLVANVYPTFTYGDYPQRWTASAPAELRSSTDSYRQTLYLWLEDQIAGPFVLGECCSALDFYVALMTEWRPGPRWFEAHAPRMVEVARRVRGLDAVREVLARNRTGQD